MSDDPAQMRLILSQLRWHLETYDPIELNFTREIFQTVEVEQVPADPTRVEPSQTGPTLISLASPQQVAVHVCRQFLHGSRYRHERDASILGGRTRAFDGELVRTLEGSYGAILPATQAKVMEDDFKITRLITLDAFGRPIADYIRTAYEKNAVRIVSGPGDTRVTLQQDSSRSGVIGIRVVLDREFDYLPVEISRLSGPLLVSTIEVARVDRTSQGLWFPAEATLKLYDYPGETNVPRLVHLERFVVDMASVRIGDSLAEDAFTVVFPNGTRVQDFVNEVSYVVGVPGTSELYAASRPAVALDISADQLPSTAGSSHSRLQPIVLGGLGAVLLGIVLVCVGRYVRICKRGVR